MPFANQHKNLDSMVGGLIVASCLNFVTFSCDGAIIDGRSQEWMEEL